MHQQHSPTPTSLAGPSSRAAVELAAPLPARPTGPRRSPGGSVHQLHQLVTVDTLEAGDGCVLCVRGELDLAGRGKVVAAAQQVTAPSVVVDMTGLTFLDASGLEELLDTRRQLDRQGRAVHLRGAHGIVRRVFDVTGLSHLLAS